MNELDIEIVMAAAKRAKERRHPSNAVADAVSGTGALVLGTAPTVAAGSSYTATSQALGGAAHDATHGQAAANEVLHTSTTIGVGMVYEATPACTRCGSEKSCHCDDRSRRRRPVPVRPQRRARRR